MGHSTLLSCGGPRNFQRRLQLPPPLRGLWIKAVLSASVPRPHPVSLGVQVQFLIGVLWGGNGAQSPEPSAGQRRALTKQQNVHQGGRKILCGYQASMRRLEVGGSREREATPGQGPAGPGPTEEYCHGGDGMGARAGQAPSTQETRAQRWTCGGRGNRAEAMQT